MPIFDFQCVCGKVWEALVPAGTPLIMCECGLVAERLVSAPKIGGVAAQKIKDRAIRGGASVTPPVRVTVPNNYKKSKSGTRGNRSS